MMKFAAFLAQFSLFFAFFDGILALKCPAADQNGRPLPEPVTVTYNEALGCLDLLSLENPLKTPSNAVLILCSSRVKTCQRAISAANGPISALNDAFSTGKPLGASARRIQRCPPFALVVDIDGAPRALERFPALTLPQAFLINEIGKIDSSVDLRTGAEILGLFAGFADAETGPISTDLHLKGGTRLPKLGIALSGHSGTLLKAFSAGIRFFELRKFDPSSISEFKRSFSEAKIERSEVKIAVNFDKIKKKPGKNGISKALSVLISDLGIDFFDVIFFEKRQKAAEKAKSDGLAREIAAIRPVSADFSSFSGENGAKMTENEPKMDENGPKMGKNDPKKAEKGPKRPKMAENDEISVVFPSGPSLLIDMGRVLRHMGSAPLIFGVSASEIGEFDAEMPSKNALCSAFGAALEHSAAVVVGVESAAGLERVLGLVDGKCAAAGADFFRAVESASRSQVENDDEHHRGDWEHGGPGNDGAMMMGKDEL
eukprot:TRINITY_DN4468_c0_g1_i2.p1 TRINITY_DN4468_c0_g1~~TRINITY_DN4468_c0_g1_i2.p1  ORF type:complete len:487 (-),score=63.21 TRINITY_DN4468_c0_g1_i2:122-1582(-)